MTIHAVGDIISEARDAQGLTQRELAIEAGVSRGTIWNWESGRCAPRPGAQLDAVALALEIPRGTLRAAA